ncbi:bifunctional 3'-5' exonuclease/DNA polymerase [Cellulomonas cellasea]|uniref:DNA-directed DNA polymerase n=2 Tax=Cellulomonas cellasea TaxID=43670 RepID=A0A0A0BA53_9CELL|nr:bifunctional 3'-5' exonuclease/DNA polymerase [Cellulomonas cellasea]KGM03760.1 3'-5' exonuclease [Cellulomonas cellasea DSM 20118]GEA86869.1 bifunctional 3'-5' exonuclease/DNA polymerase [Cellulomonas cellasea]
MPFVLLTDDPVRRGALVLHEVTDDGEPGATVPVAAADVPAAVAERERAAQPPRWVWDDTSRRYPPLLDAGVRVERCHDLRLCHAILRGSVLSAGSALALAPPGPWDGLPQASPRAPRAVEVSLFDDPRAHDDEPLDVLDELRRQLAAVAGADEPGRLRLLLAAESTGALIAAEMRHDGMPWDVREHDALLTRLLGERPSGGGRPARVEALAAEVRGLLGQPSLNLDSQPDLLRGLRSAGLDVTSTRTYEIRALDHPVTAPLLEYKKLARLLSANGWAWMDAWVHDGRFRPDYVPGGVVTGRWATSGGGALQLPAVIRGAVRADPGWRLVVADAAQLEPRVLAAMSGDAAMAAAGRQSDLYRGIVDAGIVETREQAKYAMLGAIYGATTGASAVVMPQLTRAYPRAVGLVEAAARAGERGEVVSTWLGRSSPRPDAARQAELQAAAAEGADAEDVRVARRRGRDWGRFTRNFVVQGTAAEWALCWMAALRRRLRAVEGRPHLVFFLHDEVMVHSPADVADEVAAAVRDSAAEAGRLLFGDTPVDFALQVAVVESYAEAK